MIDYVRSLFRIIPLSLLIGMIVPLHRIRASLLLLNHTALVFASVPKYFAMVNMQCSECTSARNDIESSSNLRVLGYVLFKNHIDVETVQIFVDLVVEVCSIDCASMYCITAGGISASNLNRILSVTGAKEFHCSARCSVPSNMTYQKGNVYMGGVLRPAEFSTKICSVATCRELVAITETLKK